MNDKEEKRGLIEQIYIATLSAWILGTSTKTRIRSSKTEAEVISEALKFTHAVTDEVDSPLATISSISKTVEKKKLAASNFEKLVGFRWPL